MVLCRSAVSGVIVRVEPAARERNAGPKAHVFRACDGVGCGVSRENSRAAAFLGSLRLPRALQHS
ncbi:hypothetical protein HMPREF1318_1264 [Actinomyces massiliensis F0489]|uniref:Uncharacterized protein n=1 Tax=Actinomyces massiliensis F0489 TaxID=1125718 RepID=J1GRU5_9ACTO|nr:hypothetical protein HMPREF1318_1264 [Actinomyces massiliensis F0489]